jgi:uncharacterized membrane protein YeaQ/YmgE (transglycosylase-associated protein family)
MRIITWIVVGAVAVFAADFLLGKSRSRGTA